ncbi:hypothetical protein [Leuconostoc pseudomesenteroides]|uniref:hypothetical protein n=1 Tax=Leuconostoc pseudomesenteroides TaxID=33968 RepID=UPI0015DD540B|nr:hypothetical protein [Leuconostoc pseudomesenteroides]
MQKLHPRYKQLNRADHEMYLHNRHKSLVGVAAISKLFSSFGESTKTAYKKIQKAFVVINEQVSAPKIEPNINPIIEPNITPFLNYDNFDVKGLTTNCS